MADAAVEYPEWYLHRWHFLPEGYLSRRGVALYERVIRPFYYAGQERWAIAAVIHLLNKEHPQTLLELGCGPGRGLERLVAKLGSLESAGGLDLSPFMLEAAARRLRSSPVPVDLRHGDATSSPWPHAHFDAVVAMHLAGHLPREASRAVCEEAVRVLRPGAVFVTVEHPWHHIPAAGLKRERTIRLAEGALVVQSYRKPV